MGYKIEPEFSFNESCFYEQHVDGGVVVCTIQGIRATLYPGVPKVYWYDILLSNGENIYNVEEANLKKRKWVI